MTDPGLRRPMMSRRRPASLHPFERPDGARSRRKAAAFFMQRPYLGARRLLDVEARLLRLPGDPRAELGRARPQRAGQLDDRRQTRLAAGPLEQGDLGAMEIAAITQLFLGNPYLGSGLAQVGGETLLGTHVADSSRLTTRTLQTVGFLDRDTSRQVRYLPEGKPGAVPRTFTQKVLSATRPCVIPTRSLEEHPR